MTEAISWYREGMMGRKRWRESGRPAEREGQDGGRRTLKEGGWRPKISWWRTESFLE